MAARNTQGADTAPQLVVKLIGSKLIKYYIEEPRKEQSVAREPSQDGSNLPQKVENETIKLPPDKEDAATKAKPRSGTEESPSWPALNQVPHRYCVTAPSGVCLLSDANHKKAHTLRSAPHVVLKPHSREQRVNPMMEKGNFKRTLHQKGGKDGDPLFIMVSEELQDWRKETLRNIEMQVQELDSSHSGTVDQFYLTHVFFRNEVPLKLPTLRLLLHKFSNSACPEEVHYEELVEFISDAALNEEWQENTEPEVGSVLQRSEVMGVCESTQSERPAGSAHSSETETWLQRFHRMEEAMRMCDVKNTGFIDKDQMKRLIQNYNLNFSLKLSPLKIDEAIHGLQSEGKVHLDSLLQFLKEL